MKFQGVFCLWEIFAAQMIQIWDEFAELKGWQVLWWQMYLRLGGISAVWWHFDVIDVEWLMAKFVVNFKEFSIESSYGEFY
jgi:D-alanyl-D-alanine dipeptidase